VTKINEYNDILALWIKMRQGTLSLNIENFELQELFAMIAKGRRSFELKKQTLTVGETTACVKADKALTLFMMNTLVENARKYTPEGGTIKFSASRSSLKYACIIYSAKLAGIHGVDCGGILRKAVFSLLRILIFILR
jgi:signal transduction histidine kinase